MKYKESMKQKTVSTHQELDDPMSFWLNVLNGLGS